ncbi:GNAT family N-acetyltransferase [Paenibacillus pinihumi]|uniref:GNAT family N-acetyltransferase n=1 Tax=Paenibacillus pinihumi TaxID=669462 RepID=UPI0004078AF7|nr:GNAT family N-acetyltransferase [Paenibacillus pinihumi]
MNAIRITTEQEFAAASRIRKVVFCEEQGVPEENEFDEYDVDPSTDHILVYYEGQPAAVGRLRVVGDAGKLERICVLASHRKYGLGKAVVEKLESLAKEKGLKKGKLNAQVQAENFYKRLGYAVASEVFMEENIPHVTMTKEWA